MVSKVSKMVLNIAYSEYIWPQRLWRKQLEVKAVDSTHLFTRLQRHSCNGNLCAMSGNALRNVATQRLTLSTPVMVDDITDPIANINFSRQVENAMRKNNEEMAVDLCHDSRLWLCAEDDPGIPALERIKIGMVLHQRLQKNVDFVSYSVHKGFTYSALVRAFGKH